MANVQKKIVFSGMIKSIQPRSDVWRYKLDNRTHNTIGYNIFLTGEADGEHRDYVVAISEKQFFKLACSIGDMIQGTGWTKKHPQIEYADYYRAGALKVIKKGENPLAKEPWQGDIPALEVYDWRGCRILDKRRWGTKCFVCKWAAMANVAIEYEFGVHQKFRFETFCYGPKNCKNYLMGKPRSVTYKGEGPYYDEGFLDDICTERRGEED